MCTKSIKLHRLLLLDSGLCIAKPRMPCICYCTNSISSPTIGLPILLHVDGFCRIRDCSWQKMPGELGLNLKSWGSSPSRCTSHWLWCTSLKLLFEFESNKPAYLSLFITVIMLRLTMPRPALMEPIKPSVTKLMPPSRSSGTPGMIGQLPRKVKRSRKMMKKSKKR